MKLLKPALILFIGIQGSGKGTQASALAADLDLPLIIAGDMFRAVAAEPTELGRAVKENLAHGRIMTTQQWKAVVGRYLETQDLRRGAVLDGVLRSPDQVEAFQKIVAEQSLPPLVVLYLALKEEVAFNRLLKRARADDKPAQLQERFAWSRAQTLPVVEHYRSRGTLFEIDGDQSIDDVHAAIASALVEAGVIAR